MGYTRHHAIIVTGIDLTSIGRPDHVFNAWTRAIEIFGQAVVSPILLSPINGWRSFCVAPDGSKEGWTDSEDGDTRRGLLIVWLRNSDLDWVEVQYGDDERITRIVSHSDDDD